MTNHDTGKVDAKKARIIVGDCLEVLKGFESDSIDSLVTDPPAGIGFMGQEWDHHKGGRAEWVAWMTGVMRECHRVMKPGAHGLVWAIPRTSHWTATALEDAGFEVRDICTHLFGQGFPKSLDISKAIDKAAGAEREVIGPSRHNVAAKFKMGLADKEHNHGKYSDVVHAPVTAPATESAKQWQGFGTALKPAAEFWILVRKPISEKNVAANVLKHGTGAINIDGCRIEGVVPQVTQGVNSNGRGFKVAKTSQPSQPSQLGRFPANLVLSHSPHCTDDQCDIECAIKALDEQTKDTRAGKPSGSFTYREKRENIPTSEKPISERGQLLKGQAYETGDVSGASRFFYCAKISPGERNAGLEGMPERRKSDLKNGTNQINSKWVIDPRHPDGGYESAQSTHSKNHHPTVKPQKLMRYLCRLVTPPNGVILDPFMGSGSTGLAALSEGFRFIGIEMDGEYAAIAEKRIFHRFPESRKQTKL